jgi:hypothetical protein
VVTDVRKLRVALYFLRFPMANYGSLALNYFGAGKGYLRDYIRPNTDLKSALEFLNLNKEDMLDWDCSGIEMFKPVYFICHDKETDSIVVSFRGTWVRKVKLHAVNLECLVEELRLC